MVQETVESSVHVSATNIGGISETDVQFSAGITILAGRNATNRTSFLRAIMGALGSDEVAVKGDADEGIVELECNGDTYTRTVARRNGTTVFDGDPYLDDSCLADLFAFLLESNDARRAVERGDDLYDVIMRPVDTAEIDEEIERLEHERNELKADLEELESLEQQVPELEERRTTLQAELEAKEEELAAKRSELDGFEDETAASTLEDRLEELREARRGLEATRRDLEDEKRIVEALREDRAELAENLDGLAAADEGEIDELDAEISRLRESIQTIESALGDLQSAIQLNESLVEGEAPAVLESIRGQVAGESEGTVTDKLLNDEQVVCWTCSSRVDRSQIERTVDLLREIHSDQIEQRGELRSEIDDLQAERKHLERTKSERRRLEQQLDAADSELEERTERIDRLESEVNDLEKAVDDLEAAVADHDGEDHDERLGLHRAINELEFEIEQLESQLDDVEAEIDAIEARVAERDDLEDRRDAIDTEIEALRSRIDRLESEAVDQFNEQMETILELLEFENIERIWIERLETEVKEGRRKVPKTTFDLHVVRTTESGSVYEDTIDHLSESERELVGLVFALAGYLVHEVYEHVPFMLLDSLEAFDAERLSILVDYLAQYAEYLVVALLPEDAAALDDEYQRVTDI